MRSIGLSFLRSPFGFATLRFPAMSLSVVLLGNSLVLAADQPVPPPDPAKVKQMLTKRGVGNPVEVSQINVSGKVKGVVTAIHEDNFEVTPKGGAAVTISYAHVQDVRIGMSHRQKVWIWVAVGAIIWIVIGVTSHLTI